MAFFAPLVVKLNQYLVKTRKGDVAAAPLKVQQPNRWRDRCKGEMDRMRQARFKRAVLLVALLLSSCVVVKDSPAPGCVETVGIQMTGGCFGKTAILDLTVEPENECLEITVNNCNGGVLEVRNNCGEELVLGGVQVLPSESVSLDVVEQENGEHSLSETYSNFSEHVPETDQRIEMVGTLGSQEIKIAFTKTAELCE